MPTWISHVSAATLAAASLPSSKTKDTPPGPAPGPGRDVTSITDQPQLLAAAVLPVLPPPPAAGTTEDLSDSGGGKAGLLGVVVADQWPGPGVTAGPAPGPAEVAPKEAALLGPAVTREGEAVEPAAGAGGCKEAPVWSAVLSAVPPPALPAASNDEPTSVLSMLITGKQDEDVVALSRCGVGGIGVLGWQLLLLVAGSSPASSCLALLLVLLPVAMLPLVPALLPAATATAGMLPACSCF